MRNPEALGWEPQRWQRLHQLVLSSYWRCHFALPLHDPAQSLVHEAIWLRRTVLQTLSEIGRQRDVVVTGMLGGVRAQFSAYMYLLKRLITRTPRALSYAALIADTSRLARQIQCERLFAQTVDDSRALGRHAKELHESAKWLMEFEGGAAADSLHDVRRLSRVRVQAS